MRLAVKSDLSDSIRHLFCDIYEIAVADEKSYDEGFNNNSASNSDFGANI